MKAFARHVSESDWTPNGVTPTSMASKAAFMCNPLLFAPYDKYGRIALKKRGFVVADHDYPAYMRAFRLVHEELAPRVTQDAAKLAKKSKRALTPEVAGMRIVDKYLMKEGGF